MNVGAIVSDEEQDGGVARSLTAAAMGADPRRRGDEVAVDPLCDETALFGCLTHPERTDELRLEAAQHRDEMGRRLCVVFDNQVVTFDHDCDAS
jgi:hypothetical protein